MDIASSRRGFLRNLASLPLIGGGVTLIGSPTGAAVKPSKQLQDLYLGWLRLEHTKLMHEIVDRPVLSMGPGVWQQHAPCFALPHDPSLIGTVKTGSASGRAAVMLSAAGVDWRSPMLDGEDLANRSQKRGDLDPFRPHRPDFEPG